MLGQLTFKNMLPAYVANASDGDQINLHYVIVRRSLMYDIYVAFETVNQLWLGEFRTMDAAISACQADYDNQ